MSTITDYTLTAESVAAVLEHMTGDWTTDQPNPHYVKATRDDGLALGFHSHTYGPSAGKVEVYPEGSVQHVRYDESRPKVNVSMTRTPQAVAGDLSRRLIAGAEAFHAVILDRIAVDNAYNAAVLANVATLAEVPGVEPRNTPHTKYPHKDDDGRGRIRIGSVWGDYSVGRDDVRMELHSIPADLARDVLALIASRV